MKYTLYTRTVYLPLPSISEGSEASQPEREHGGRDEERGREQLPHLLHISLTQLCEGREDRHFTVVS